MTIAIGVEVTATLSLRASFQHPAWLAVVIAGYAGAFAALAMVLRQGMPIGVAYGIWAAAGVALTALLAAILFADPLTWLMILGISLIAGGVLLVETGAKVTEDIRKDSGF